MRAENPSCVTLLHYLAYNHPKGRGETPDPSSSALFVITQARFRPLPSHLNAKDSPTIALFKPGPQVPFQCPLLLPSASFSR